MMTDTVADMITRIRNCNREGRADVSMPGSKIRLNIAEALKREGYVSDVQFDKSGKFPMLSLRITFGPNGEKSFTEIQRVSKPGCRVYKSIKDVEPVRSGLGNIILSTPKGILSDREARDQKVGGELLFSIQ